MAKARAARKGAGDKAPNHALALLETRLGMLLHLILTPLWVILQSSEATSLIVEELVLKARSAHSKAWAFQ